MGASPLIGSGLAGMTLISLLPWAALFAAFIGAAMLQSHYLPFSLGGVTVGSITIRPEMGILIPIAFRALLMSKPQYRPRWGSVEFLLLGWILLNPLTSFVNSPSFFRSIQPAGELALGFAAFITVYTAVSTKQRLWYASRLFVGFLLFESAYGFVATVGHYLAGTNFGVSVRSEFGAGTYGTMYEHDIFASTCAATAIICYVLWREQSTLFSNRTYVWGFWVSVISMFAGLARAGWIGFFLALVAVAIVLRRTRRPAKLERAGLMMFGLAAMIALGSWLFLAAQTYQPTTYQKSVTKSGGGTGSVVNGLFQKINDLTNVTTGTGAARLSETKQALGDLKHSPLIGLGTFTYDQRHPLKTKTNYIGDMWLRALYDTGLVGLLLIVVAIGIALWPSRSLLQARSPTATIARALTFGWMPLVVAYAATDDTLFMWPWIFLALIRASRSLAEREHRADRRARLQADRAPALAAPAAG